MQPLNVLAVVGWLIGGRLAAQTEYYNTDGGRPLRVEDATPTARYAFDFHFPTARVERFGSGVSRLRVEPAVAYGILPRTAIEARAAFVYREAAASPRAGMSGFGIGVTHALNTETSWLPAVAIGGEVFEPTGAAKTGGPAYSVRTHITRTWTLGRIHANATFGNYNLTVPQQSDTLCGPGSVIGPGGRCFASVPPIPDGPCALSPVSERTLAMGRCSASERVGSASQAALAANTSKLRGAHWVVGLGADHAVPLASVLFMTDVFGERFDGLFDRWDWTAELGARHQVSQFFTLDAAVGRRFAGVTRAWIFTAGLTRSMSLAARSARRAQ